MSSAQDVRAERLKKLQILKDSGINPYPVESHRTLSIAEFVSMFDALQAPETLAGRIMAKRGQGGIIFLDVFDGTGRVQFVLEKTDLGDESFDLFEKTVDQGDFIEAQGVTYTTKRGERSLKAQKWAMLSKSLAPIPDEWFGLKDPELRLRERYLDLLLSPELRAMIERKSKFWATIRSFLVERGFLEIETPIFENSPGGADARPFITHHNSLDIDVYLRISAGELWQKRALVAGFPKVFEIGRIFRNEGMSNEHLQDYTQVELYEAYSDYTRGMQLIQQLYRKIAQELYGKLQFTIRGHELDLSGGWPLINFVDVIKERFGIDALNLDETRAVQVAREHGVLDENAVANGARAVDQLWKIIRKEIAGPAFLVGIPDYLEPLAKRNPLLPQTVERFQVIIAGSENGKGFSELNDPIDQEQRFEAQQAMRDAGDEEAQRLDKDYVHALEYGMPPAFGFGVSERLFAFFEDKPVNETLLFPLLRPKNE